MLGESINQHLRKRHGQSRVGWRLIGFVCRSTLGLRVKEKKKKGADHLEVAGSKQDLPPCRYQLHLFGGWVVRMCHLWRDKWTTLSGLLGPLVTP